MASSGESEVGMAEGSEGMGTGDEVLTGWKCVRFGSTVWGTGLEAMWPQG